MNTNYLESFWKIITCEPLLKQNQYEISDFGEVHELQGSTRSYAFKFEERFYHSTNGYDFILLNMKNNFSRLLAIDTLVAKTFIPIPKELIGKPLKIVHKDGDTRNNSVTNLEWQEFVEEWKDLVCPIQMISGEIINPVPGRYKISSHGRIWSHLTKSFIRMRPDAGYIQCTLTYVLPDGSLKGKNIGLHRAMALSFNLPGRTKERNQINHINGNRSDFNLKNLEWTTEKENVVHAFKTQLEVNPVGEAHPRAKFTNHQRECYYEIMITLKDVEPYKVAEIIASRLPAITKDDVKYAKQLLKKQRGVVFPLLDFRHPHKYTQEESEKLYEIANKIFDKYNITEKEGYVNEHRKTPKG